MLHNERIILSILIALLTSIPLATIITRNAYAQQEMTPTQTFETQEQYNKIALSADSKHIIAISDTTDYLAVFNQTHMLWNTHVTGISSIAMSENASLIAAATNSGIHLFNPQNPTPQQHYDLSYEKPMIALSSDGNTLAYAATSTYYDINTTTVYLFDTRNQNPTWHTTLPGTLQSLSTSGNGNHTTITTNQPGAVYLFSKQPPTPLWTYNLGQHSGAAKISNDGNYIIATGGNQTKEPSLRVYRFSHQSPQPDYIKIISELPTTPRLTVSSQGTIFALAFAETDRLIFFNLDLPPYGYGPGSILNITLPSKPTAITMSSEGRYTAVGSNTGIYIYEYMNSELTLTKQYTNNNPHITDIAITPDGWHLAATANNTIYLFDIVQIQNGTSFWLYMIVLAVTIAVSIISIYIPRRKHKPQKLANTN
jgi:6-phosphogluconolactonase (cycloisomerase 2 family)